MNDCGYGGNLLEMKTDISSLMRCARDCFKNKYCTSFNFVSSTCYLMNTVDSNQLNNDEFSTCGEILNRFPQECTWQTSDDGSYQWADNCMLNYFESDTKEKLGLFPANSTRTCAEACLANPNCYYFYYQVNPNNILNSCRLEKITRPSFESQTPAGNGYSIHSGFIIARKFNVEFIPNYCDLK